jgi:hypothetical protein
LQRRCGCCGSGCRGRRTHAALAPSLWVQPRWADACRIIGWRRSAKRLGSASILSPGCISALVARRLGRCGESGWAKLVDVRCPGWHSGRHGPQARWSTRPDAWVPTAQRAKKITALALARDLKAAGVAADFRATGRTRAS